MRQICQTYSSEDVYNENSEKGSNPKLAVDELPVVAHTFNPRSRQSSVRLRPVWST